MASNAKIKGPRVDYPALMKIGTALLVAIGEDPDRPGLKDTPRRFADAWREFIEYNPGRIGTTFDKITADQMVVVSGMRVYSYCEHHLLPFSCVISIGYIAEQKVIGLSKCARIAHKHAHTLQIQERLVEQIAKEIIQVTSSDDVAVYGSGEHSCMSTRGIKTEGVMTCSYLNGRFKHDTAMRAEFMSIVRGNV